MSLWERLAGGIVPVARKHEREVYVSGGAAYARELVWLRRSLTIKYSTPTTPRDVRKIRDADQRRITEQIRRLRAGEPTVQVGDVIPKYTTAFLERCWIVRDAELTLWKRTVGAERYDSFGSSQEYEWVMWAAGEWGGGWRADDAAMLDEGSPLTVMELIKHAAS
jgi:hypothetical protein